MAQILYPPSQNALQKSLDAQLDQADTTSMTLNNVTGIQNKPGVVLINRINSAGTELEASRREWIKYTAVSGSTLTGLTRAQGGSTDQDHAVGSVVEFVMDAVTFQALIDAFIAEHGEDGTHSADAIDAITEIASALKTGSDTTLVTGTAGTTNNIAIWNADGDLVDGGSPISASDGWVAESNSFTYASATSVTVSGVDVTSTYTPGTKVKLTNDGGTDYYVVSSSSFSINTTINFAPQDSYALANSAITNPYYSYSVNPQGWPGWFNYASTVSIAGFSPAPTVNECRYMVNGRSVTFILDCSGTSNATSFTYSVPITSASTGGDPDIPCSVLDNSSWQSNPGVTRVRNASTTADIGKTISTIAGAAYAGFTSSGSKGASLLVTYRI